MTLQDLVNYSALIAGVVAIFELAEYLVTRNIPWLARLLSQFWQRLRRRFGPKPAGQRYLALNFSAHPLMPEQQEAIRIKMGWPALEIIETGLANVPEGRHFAPKLLAYVERINLLPAEWQKYPLVVIPAGYAPAWSVLLAELHGRLGYFPDLVRLRPGPARADEKYEVAEIISLSRIRNEARARRGTGAGE